MKKIGQGWQYKVYDLNNGRVKKQAPAAFIQYSYILRNNVFSKWNIFADTWRNMQRVKTLGKLSNAYIKEILPIFDVKLLGNPVFVDDGYEQDKVITLGDVLETCSVAEGKNIFDAYVKLIHTTWQYGFADTVFNFRVNNSLDIKWQVIQIDFGELVFDKADVLQQISNKQWLRCASYKLFPDGVLKNYYRDLMEQQMTIDNLEELWGKEIAKLNHIPAKKTEVDASKLNYTNTRLSFN